MSLTKTLAAGAIATSVMVLLGVSGTTAKTFKLTAGSSHPPIVPWVQVIKDHKPIN